MGQISSEGPLSGLLKSRGFAAHIKFSTINELFGVNLCEPQGV